MGKDGDIDRYIFDDFVFDLPEGIHAFEENLRLNLSRRSGNHSKITNNIRDIAARLDALEFL